MTPSRAILLLIALYLLVGAIVAGWVMFVRRASFDPDAREGSLGFRFVTFPGATLLWPILLRASRPRTESIGWSIRQRRAHLTIWLVLPALLLGGLLWAWSIGGAP